MIYPDMFNLGYAWVNMHIHTECSVLCAMLNECCLCVVNLEVFYGHGLRVLFCTGLHCTLQSA